MPTSGGIRVALVATDPASKDGAGGAAPPQAQTGTVSLGDQSRFVVEMGADEALNVFYILEVVNPAGSACAASSNHWSSTFPPTPQAPERSRAPAGR